MSDAAHEFDPFINTDAVDEDEETLRLLEEDVCQIDEGRVKMLTAEEAREHFRRWVTRSPTVLKR
ncbi:MAG TPA: hypothetical protein VH351_04310 [Bryobacteraceae bacterium]|jgi:hypothetical protein|nr:hypothetical protein [Bryobacteraceae bacterium]